MIQPSFFSFLNSALTFKPIPPLYFPSGTS